MKLTLSIGVTVIIAIRDCFPTHRMLLLGFDFHADQVSEFHYFNKEKELIQEIMSRDKGKTETVGLTQIPEMLRSRCPVR